MQLNSLAPPGTLAKARAGEVRYGLAAQLVDSHLRRHALMRCLRRWIRDGVT